MVTRRRSALLSLVCLSLNIETFLAYVFIGIPEWYTYMGLVQGSSYSNSIIGVINCIYSIGGVFGCVFNMWAAEYFGRKRSIQLGCIVAIFSAALMTGSVNIPMFVVSRLIMGFAIGQLVTLVPLYQVSGQVATCSSKSSERVRKV